MIPALPALCAALLLALPSIGAGASEGAGLFSADDGAIPPRPALRHPVLEGPLPEIPPRGETLPRRSEPPPELRRRNAEIDLERLAAARSEIARGRPSHLRLNLFADADFQAVFERAEPTASGYALKGRLADDPLSAAVLAVNGEWVAGQVWGPRGRYAIVPLGGGVAAVRQMDPSALGRCGVGEGLAEGAAGRPPFEAPPPGLRQSPGVAAIGTAFASEAFPEDDGGAIDLLVVYESSVRRTLGGHRAMRALIDSDVAMANEMYRASGAAQQINLAAAVELERRPEAREAEQDRNAYRFLNHLSSKSSGYLDEAHALRDAYAADMVLAHWGHQMGTGVFFGGVAGIAWQMETLSGDSAPLAFAVANSSAFAHELGHGMGLRHERSKDAENSPFPYSHGFVVPDGSPELPPERAGRGMQTVMAASRNPPKDIPRFSNPNLRYPDDSGPALGVPGDEPSDAADGPADAARSLNRTRRTVANFRRSASRCAYALSGPPEELPVSGGEFRIRVRAGAGCAWRAHSNDEFVSVADGAAGVGDGEFAFRLSDNAGWERELAVFVAGEAYLAEQATARTRGETPVCDRTAPIRDALVEAAGKPCEEIGAEDLAAVRTLAPHFSGAGRLALGDFDGLTGLVSLDLYQAHLRGWAPGTFDGLTRLVSLDLRYNYFRTLEPGAFDGLPNLVFLDLRSTRLTTLKPGAFRGLSNVQELKFRGSTGLTALAAGSFEGLSNLRLLDLGATALWLPLAKIEPGAFRGLPELRNLVLTHDNTLTTLEPGVFEGLPNLRILSLIGNADARIGTEGLTTLPLGLFEGLPKLRSLYLNENSLKTLPPGLFNGLTELTSLDLRGNKLSFLERGAFDGLTELTSLDLRGNKLSFLERGAFDGLSALEWLYLDRNGLTELGPGVFDGLAKLSILYLNENNLKMLDPALFHHGRSQMFLLYLEGNQLATLDSDLLRGMIRLKVLNLESNRLSDLPPRLFEGLHSFNKLDLRGNPGAPFAFAPELIRHPGVDSAPDGSAQITAEVAQGAPFNMRIPLSAAGGVLSAGEILIPKGAVRGMAVSVVPRGKGPVTVLATAPDLPPPCEDWEIDAAHSEPCLWGLKTSSGAPLILYGLPDQALAPDGAVRFDLPSAFPGFGAGTSYRVESSNPAAVEARIREGLLIVSTASGGETILTVTATSPDGTSETRRFAAKAPVLLRSRWSGWRSVLLKPPPSEDGDGS